MDIYANDIGNSYQNDLLIFSAVQGSSQITKLVIDRFDEVITDETVIHSIGVAKVWENNEVEKLLEDYMAI